jgi:flagellar basal body rod protein FlgG
MSDINLNQYYSPLDNLLNPSNIASGREIAADKAINSASKENSQNSFQEVLSNYAKSAKGNSEESTRAGCYPLTPMACDDKSSLDQGQKSIQEQINRTIENITNASEPGYKKVSSIVDANGQVIEDQSSGAIVRTNWYLDLALDGEGKGFELADGRFTRDGRFRLDREGKPVSFRSSTPLKICYEDGAPVDWSMKRLKVDLEGKVYDLGTGKKLGEVQVDKKESGKVLQNYIEKSNVNLPLEFMGLQQKLRILDMMSNVFGTGSKLDGEAINLARNT